MKPTYAEVMEAINAVHRLGDAVLDIGNEDAVREDVHAIRKVTDYVRDMGQWKPFDTAPKDGRSFYVQNYYLTPFRWKPYSPKSQQYKRGKKGRWQEMNEYGGWDNTNKTPSEWKPHPDDVKQKGA